MVDVTCFAAYSEAPVVAMTSTLVLDEFVHDFDITLFASFREAIFNRDRAALI